MAKVLVIDEDKEFIEELRIGLGPRGCQVQAADDGDHGVLVAKYDPPDLALVSLDLTIDGGGLAVCKKFHEESGLGDVPIMVTSVHAFQPNPELAAIVADYVSGLDSRRRSHRADVGARPAEPCR